MTVLTISCWRRVLSDIPVTKQERSLEQGNSLKVKKVRSLAKVLTRADHLTKPLPTITFWNLFIDVRKRIHDSVVNRYQTQPTAVANLLSLATLCKGLTWLRELVITSLFVNAFNYIIIMITREHLQQSVLPGAPEINKYNNDTQ